MELERFKGHTPGPWWSESGTIHAKNPLVWTEEHHSCVHPAQVSELYWESDHTLEEQEANEELIAAAPDLLAEVERLRGALEKLSEDLHRIGVWGLEEQARAALRDCP